MICQTAYVQKNQKILLAPSGSAHDRTFNLQGFYFLLRALKFENKISKLLRVFSNPHSPSPRDQNRPKKDIFDQKWLILGVKMSIYPAYVGVLL